MVLLRGMVAWRALSRLCLMRLRSSSRQMPSLLLRMPQLLLLKPSQHHQQLQDP